jgi:hypothetical protein
MKIAWIPDTQVKPGVPLVHLSWIGEYMAAKKPDIIICAGDFSDMESLSSYDVGKRSFEGRSYERDIEASREGMALLMNPIKREMARVNAPKRHGKKWRPRLEMLYGNHEDRIDRAVENDRKLEGLMSKDDLGYAEFGWTTHEFLDVLTVEDIAFSHFFASGRKGLPCVSAQSILNKKHQSCVAGHQQGRQVAYGTRADGRSITTVIAGSCYLHDEVYMGNQGNQHWRGIMFMHEVKNGTFDEMFVSLNYLERKYEGEERLTKRD